MADACRRPAPENPGLQLGAAIGEAALAGRDKLTILTSPRLASLGDWIEQLVAESTGKAGAGSCRSSASRSGGRDVRRRTGSSSFISLAGDSDPAWEALVAELERLGHPASASSWPDPLDIGAEFVRWEVATAAAGILLGIDPFDQPNVQEAKDATRHCSMPTALMAALAAAGPAGGGAEDWPPMATRTSSGTSR